MVNRMRNKGIELLRVLLMLGICGIHVAAFMGGAWKYLGKTLWPCVVAFVFISGYYGVKFSVKKVVRLCGMGLWCAIVAAGLTFAFLRGGGTWYEFYRTAFSNYKSFWFLHAYVFMMFFAPIIDAAFTKETALKLGLPILFLVFGWSFAYSFNAARQFVVGMPGFGAQSGLTLVGIYVFARMFRLLEWERCLSSKKAIAILVLALPLTAIRFGIYDSPIALLVAMALFVLASRARIENESVCAVVAFVTPSLFSIYLLHVNSFGWSVLPQWIKEFMQVRTPSFVVFVGMVFGVFIAGLMIDLIRRMVIKLCSLTR